MAVLQMRKGFNPGQVFPLEGNRSVLGRHPECDIVLEVGAISRQHAQILLENGTYFVEDLKSRNGTYLNGRMIDGKTELNENDRVKICDMLFTFHHEPPGPKPSNNNQLGVTLAEDDRDLSATIMSKISADEHSSLRVGVRPEVKLKALLEITKNLSNTLKVEDVLPKILESLFKVFVQADRGFLLLVDHASGNLIPKAVLQRRGDSDENMRISRTIINQALRKKEGILSADAVNDDRFDMAASIADFRIRSMICVPMFTSDGQPLGVIQLDTQEQNQRFEQNDLDVLFGVASQAAFAIENAQLHEDLLNKQAIERELEFAYRVQRGFLPFSRPEVENYSFFDSYDPAQSVGGDYYDYVELPDGRIAVVLGDVSGKGVPAALLVAKLASEFRYALLNSDRPATAAAYLNEQFCRPHWEDKFVTLVLMVLDPNHHQVTLVNAGHMPPLLKRHTGVVEELDQETEFPLGVMDQVVYRQFTIKLEAGDSIAVFTDGFSEAMNSERDLYGLDRLNHLLANHSGTAEELGQLILDDVREFTGKFPQSDDMCLVTFGRTA
ncbi:Serine phosphatase RsbU, regulator of sigma subunit [Planctomycetales bacterium 10988]|nr:Serine phosphatase RsbU, regulator of sigma subunit [Planctomycetales bacterium 10988]